MGISASIVICTDIPYHKVGNDLGGGFQYVLCSSQTLGFHDLI